LSEAIEQDYKNAGIEFGLGVNPLDARLGECISLLSKTRPDASYDLTKRKLRAGQTMVNIEVTEGNARNAGLSGEYSINFPWGWAPIISSSI